MISPNTKTDLILRILDLIKGQQVYHWHNLYKKTLHWNRQQTLAYCNKRFKSLVKHAVQTVPFYKQAFPNSEEIIKAINSTSDIHLLPIIDRDTIRENQDLLISDKYNIMKLYRGSSSGTTGIPINYYADKDGLSAGIAAGYILCELSGWKLGQRNLHIWGNQSSIERWNTFSSKAKNFLIQQKNFASTLLNDSSQTKELVESIISYNPITIDGYSSSIYTLAEYFETNNLRINNLKLVLTTAENLEDYQRHLIERVFGSVGDLYGSGEVLGIASRPVNDNKYYIFEPHVYIETINSGIPGMKDILITDLDNYGMPIIRYKVGDMIDEIRDPDPYEMYPFRWFSKIHGRSSDIITLPNGMKFHPVNIFGGTLFRKFHGISRHKVVWDGRKLEFIFETKSFRDTEALQITLKDLLQDYHVDFTIRFTELIEPSKSGKYKYVEILEKEESN